MNLVESVRMIPQGAFSSSRGIDAPLHHPSGKLSTTRHLEFVDTEGSVDVAACQAQGGGRFSVSRQPCRYGQLCVSGTIAPTAPRGPVASDFCWKHRGLGATGSPHARWLTFFWKCPPCRGLAARVAFVDRFSTGGDRGRPNEGNMLEVLAFPGKMRVFVPANVCRWPTVPTSVWPVLESLSSQDCPLSQNCPPIPGA